MKCIVNFDAGERSFALPVESTTGVRAGKGIVQLPGSRADILGILPGEPPITVLPTLGAGHDHILLLTVKNLSFGLLVDAATGVIGVKERDIGPPPKGQDLGSIAGTLGDVDNLVVIVDPRVLASRL